MSKEHQFANEITSLTAIQTPQETTTQLIDQLNENSSLSQKQPYETPNSNGPSKVKYMY